MKTEEILQGFAVHQKALHQAESTLEWYGFLLKRFFDYLASQDITELAQIDGRLLLKYQQFVSELKNEHGKPYAVATQNLHMIVIKTLFRYLLRTGEAKHDPTTGMELARVPKQLPKCILTEQEMIRLLKQPDLSTTTGKRDRAIMELLYSSGIRADELASLDLRDITMEERSLFVRKGKGSKDRVTPFGKLAARYLQLYLESRNELVSSHHPTDALFLSYRGKRLDNRSLENIVGHYTKKAGIEKTVSPHCFRHTCATHLLDNGASLVTIKELLGHEKLDTTALYLHLSITNLKANHTKYHPRERAA